MSSLPTDALGAARLLLRNLYRPIELTPGKKFFAVAETEHPIGGDDWLWTDDNAKVLEFVSRPEIWRRFPEQPRELLRFIEAMCRGPFIFRRVSAPRLERVDGDGPVGNFTHSLMHVRSELPREAVLAGLRFHDGRTADNLMLAGNAVEFTHRGRRIILDVRDAISDAAAEQRGKRLTLRHSGELVFRQGWRQVRLGRIGYTYTIDARSMLIGAEAVLEVDPAVAVSDVVLTIGHDHLSHGTNGVRYDAVAAAVPGAAPVRFAAGESGRSIVPAGGAPYYAIAQAEIAGFALGIHSAPRDPRRLAEIELRVLKRGQLHLARARYRFPGSCRGARLAVAEDKMLTAGGFYDRVADYAELLQSAAGLGSSAPAATDYSVSYDYGSEINAFAKCFAVCTGEADFQENKELAELSKALFDTYLRYYEDCFVSGHLEHKNTIMSRQLAFVILGIATMFRATGARPYLDKLRALSNVLLDFAVRFADLGGAPAAAFSYGMHSERAAFVDGHSASLLALTRARQYIDDPRFVEAIDLGLAAYCWETRGVGHPIMRKVDVVSTSIVVDGIPGRNGPLRHTESSYWNFNVGLALRFFNAIRASAVPELRAIAAKYRDRMELFEMVMRRQIERSIVERGDAIEIKTSIHASETNSETQPWVMLGLLGHPYD